jgi:hypothetical protein
MPASVSVQCVMIVCDHNGIVVYSDENSTSIHNDILFICFSVSVRLLQYSTSPAINLLGNLGFGSEQSTHCQNEALQLQTGYFQGRDRLI